jgi:hypothetical protein
LVAISKILYEELDFLEGDKIMRTTREELLKKEVIENFNENINSTSLENGIINRIANILERLPNKGENIDLELFKEERKKTEVCTSIA